MDIDAREVIEVLRDKLEQVTYENLLLTLQLSKVELKEEE